jgi:hypothetical protein
LIGEKRLFVGFSESLPGMRLGGLQFEIPMLFAGAESTTAYSAVSGTFDFTLLYFYVMLWQKIEEIASLDMGSQSVEQSSIPIRSESPQICHQFRLVIGSIPFPRKFRVIEGPPAGDLKDGARDEAGL